MTNPLNHKYQLLFLGDDYDIFKRISDSLNNRLAELGIPQKEFAIYYNVEGKKCKGDQPIYCIYSNQSFEYDKYIIEVVNRLKRRGDAILPLFVTDFSVEIHSDFNEYNGERKERIDAIVNHILESFELLRRRRRLFISYKRSDTRQIAIQLYEKFESLNYNVFLDIHSVPKGALFQKQLWHYMTDSDLIILLDSQNFLSSEWCTEELAFAECNHISIIRLKFPSSSISDGFTDFTTTIKIQEEEIVENELSESILKVVENVVESSRVRSLAARQSRIITNFINIGSMHGKRVSRQEQSLLAYKTDEENMFYFIPVIGVPESRDFHLIELNREQQLKEAKQCYLIYDDSSLLEDWKNHLKWLDSHLYIKSLVCDDFKNWFNTH